jgi:hypothetical protein
MTLPLFVVIFLAAAGALAIWVDSRFPGLMPGRTGIVVNLLLAFVCCDLGSRFVAPALAGTGLPASRAIAVVGLVLPLVVYVCIVGLWLLRMLSDPLRAR